MKKYAVIVCLFFPTITMGQPTRSLNLKTFKPMPSAPAWQTALTRAARTAQFAAFKRTHPVQKILFKQTPAPSLFPRLKNAVLTTQQRDAFLNRYQETLQDFARFKSRSQGMLYYQSNPLEAREFSIDEERQWLQQMIPLRESIKKLSQATLQDEALSYALDYMQYSISVIDPFLLSSLTANEPPLEIPSFNPKEFFLYAADAAPLPEPYVDLTGKKIQILNDNVSLLRYFESLFNMGVLFPEATLKTEENGLYMLLNLTPDNTPDILFTDIELGKINGFYIARTLRERGYTGGIIALSHYPETEDKARILAAAGFDGLVSLDNPQANHIHITLRLTQAAQVYLQHKKSQATSSQ